MAKLRDKIAVSIIRLVNVNPEKKDRVIKKLKFFTRLGRLVPGRPKRGFERVEYDANGVPLEIFKRKNTDPEKLVFIIHGGVFIMGMVNTYRAMHRMVSDAADGAAVAIIDYRTAPESKYPAAHDDVMAGWEFLKGLGYKPRDIILMGDSSGGNLVLSLLLRLRDNGAEMPAAAVLMSPWTDLTAAGESYRTNYRRDIIFGAGSRNGGLPDDSVIRKMLDCGVFSYARDADRRDPYLSPVFGGYHGMPPVLMTVGGYEMLLCDTLAVAEKINAAGGSAEVIVGKGMFHAYPLYYQLSPAAKEAFGKILAFISRHANPDKTAI